MRKAGFISPIRTAVVTAILTGFLFLSAPAQAILITNDYVFIGPKQGAATFSLKNLSETRAAYRLFWREVTMVDNGRRVILDSVKQAEGTPNLMPASPYLYAAPRRMMVQPRQTQHLRFMARRIQNMPAGEYRSYIEIKPEEIPDEFEGRDIDLAPDRPGVELNLKMLSGVRLPVFMLHGETTLDVGFENVRWVNEPGERPTVKFTLRREGTRSAIGTLDFRCQKQDGRTKYVGRRSIVKIFTELNRRNLSRRLDEADMAECVSPISMNFTPHKEDPAFNDTPIASVVLPDR